MITIQTIGENKQKGYSSQLVLNRKKQSFNHFVETKNNTFVYNAGASKSNIDEKVLTKLVSLIEEEFFLA